MNPNELGRELPDKLPPGFTDLRQPKKASDLPSPAPQARLTITRHFYHQRAGRVAACFSLVTSLPLSSGEQVYAREDVRLLGSAGWTPIDLGWVKLEDVGLIVLKNEGGDPLMTVPSENEGPRVIEWGVLSEVKAPLEPATPELKKPVTAWDPPTPKTPPAGQSKTVAIILPVGEVYPGLDLQVHRPVAPNAILIRTKADYCRYSLQVFPK